MPLYPLPIVLISHQFTSDDENSDQSIHRKVKYIMKKEQKSDGQIEDIYMRK